ncbi:hypothetical protein AYL99_11015 [Fonsecaea erecta]|uniref:Uncharacterized protein n=1 Tax=Fonsecaea erecta TaxID=1367422 RepID=A0A178Z4A3_9EURO|nr:hypothetical protein AYL99_11015 [Fonsecaea erecta]OAP54567.1 hypothetical protein AYL99_11015 [Fonsecaea erecta]
MSADVLLLQTALNLLKSADVATVVVGELVLNYYNDIEVCVPSSQFSAAVRALNSSPLFKKLPPRTPNLFTGYKNLGTRLRELRSQQMAQSCSMPLFWRNVDRINSSHGHRLLAAG